MKFLQILILHIQINSMHQYNIEINNDYKRNHLNTQELKTKNKNSKIAYAFISFLWLINLGLTILDYSFVNNENILGIIFNGVLLLISSLYLILFNFFQIYIKYLFLLSMLTLIILNAFLGFKENDSSIYSIFIPILSILILLFNSLIINYQYSTGTFEEILLEQA